MRRTNEDFSGGVLAIRIVGVDMRSRPQEEEHVFLPSTAFARITNLRHDEAFVETGDYADWGSAKPVLLPMCTKAEISADVDGCTCNPEIELQVSLWEKQKMGKSEEALNIMLDAVAEVTLPALGDLGMSEQQAVERAVSLERHGREIGTVIVRAWKFVQEKHQRASLNRDGGVIMEDVDSSPEPAALVPHDTTTDVDESNGDENLFFELSNSSESRSGTSSPLTIPGSSQSSGEISTVVGPSQSAAGIGIVEDEKRFRALQEKHLLGNQREAAMTVDDPGRPGGCDEIPEVVERKPEHHLAESAQKIQGVFAEQGAAKRTSSTFSFDAIRHPERASIPARPSDQSEVTKRHSSSPTMFDPIAAEEASDDLGTKQPLERGSTPLDLRAIMLLLIPSYSPGSANVRVRMRNIVLPAGAAPATPPYVRVGLHPGAHSIARTSLAMSLRSNRDDSSGDDEGDSVLLTKAFPDDNVAKYSFGATLGGVIANNDTLVLPLGPDIVRMTSAAHSGPTPPTIRLQIVSGRSLGHCDLALPEVLRRPGSSLRRLQVPIWKKQNPQGQGTRNAEHKQAIRAPGKQEEATVLKQNCVRTKELAGQVEFDLGVVLTGRPECSPSGAEDSAGELTSGVVIIQALAFRVGDVGERRVGFETTQGAMEVMGISARLSLGAETHFATLDRRSHDKNGVELSEPGRPPAIESTTAGKCLLRSICTQLDVLTVSFNHRRWSEGMDGCGLRMGGDEGQGRGRDVLAVAVSDINDIFDGSWQWVAMDNYGSEGNAAGRSRDHLGNKAGEAGDEIDCPVHDAGGRLEVQLRVRLVHETPIDEQELCQTFSPESEADANKLLSAATCPEESRVGDEQFLSSLQAWYESPNNRHSQALAMVPSLENRGRVQPYGGKMDGNYFVGDKGPGVFQLEVLAIHGGGREEWPSRAAHGECNRRGDCRASSAQSLRPWWVRASFAAEAGEGKNNSVKVDSSAGLLSSHKEGGDWSPADNACATPPLRQKQGERCDHGMPWVVDWPDGGRASVKCPVHWTTSQTVLPVTCLEVFRGQTLIARSVLELPPLVAREGPLAFTLPCMGVKKREPSVPITASSSSDSDDAIFLDLQSSFRSHRRETPRGEERGAPNQGLESSWRLSSGASRSRSIRNSLRGGMLFVQVVAVRRIHRELRSALALPCSVIFTLPQHDDRSCAPMGWTNRAEHVPTFSVEHAQSEATSDHGGCEDDMGGQTTAGFGEGEVAVLMVQPQQGGSLMVLATMLEGSTKVTRVVGSDAICGQDSDSGDRKQRVLGSTWLPVRADVMERGHLEDGWYPLRLAGRGWRTAPKACDIRLRIHYMPRLLRPARGLTPDRLSSLQQQAQDGNDRFLTIIIEEGRDLTHQALPVGPLDLFSEVLVEAQASCGLVEPSCNSSCKWSQRSPVAVGPLPLREGALNSCRGLPPHAEVARLGKGASPSWQHIMRIPLPKDFVESNRTSNEPAMGFNPKPRDKRRPWEACPSRALLSVSIKSSARRVITRHPPEMPRSLLSSSSTGEVDLSGETIVERCLLLGTARIRLPSYLFSEGGGSAIRGWYTIKDEASGEHRGKVRLSIFPVGNNSADVSSTFARQDNARFTDEIAKKSRERCYSEAGPALDSSCIRWSGDSPAAPNHRQPTSIARTAVRAGEDTDECVLGCCGGSEGADEVAEPLRKAEESGGRAGLQGYGLLFVSIGDVVLRTSSEGEEKRVGVTGQDVRLTGAIVSLQQKPDGSRQSDKERGTALSIGFNGEMTAVLAVGQPSVPDDFQVLDVQVYVNTPQRKKSIVYHGAIPLVTCFSNAGIAIQEEKCLNQTAIEGNIQGNPCRTEKYVRTTDEDEKGPTMTRIRRRTSFDRSYDDRSSGRTETSSTSSEGDVRSCDAEEGSKRDCLKARGCCTVIVTTTFVPHARGKLQIRLSELRFIPPSPCELERWRSLTDLRQRTETEAVGASIPSVHATAWKTTTATRSAFLRVRVLPSGPWGFSRTFPLQRPRPADWGRDPAGAGMINLPDETRVVLEVDTSTHTVARKCLQIPSSLLPPPTGGGAQDEADVEAMMLEVCLFDNGGCPSSFGCSSFEASSPSSVLGCGTVALNPAMFLGGRENCDSRLRREAGVRDLTNEKREGLTVNRVNTHVRQAARSDTVLYGLASGERVASVAVETDFSPHQACDGHAPPRKSPMTDDIKTNKRAWIHEISDLSAGVWALKSMFYELDPENTGFVWLENVLIGLAQERRLAEASTSSATCLRSEHIKKGVGRGAISSEEAGGNGSLATMLDRLLGFGVRMGGSRGGVGVDGGDQNRVGTDGDVEKGEDVGESLLRFVRHLLTPSEPVSDHSLVSWEVWAALSEVIMGRMEGACQRGLRRTVPAVSSVSVWQRAEELRCDVRKPFGHLCGGTIRRLDSRTGIHVSTKTGCQKRDRRQNHNHHSTAKPCILRADEPKKAAQKTLTRDTSQSRSATMVKHPREVTTNPRQWTGSYSTERIEDRPEAGFGGDYGASSEGYGDLSTNRYPTHDENSSDENGVLKRATGRNASSRQPCHRNVPSATPVRTSGRPGPLAEESFSGRLRQALATTRRAWRSSSEQKRVPRQVLQRRGKMVDDDRTKRLSTSASVDCFPSRRPNSAPAAPAASRSASREGRDLAPSFAHTCKGMPSARHGTCATPSERVQACSAGGMPGSDALDGARLDGKKWRLARETGAAAYGVWGESGASGESGDELVSTGGIPEMPKRENVFRELEVGCFRTETASAKRKASKFRTCMLEAKVALDKAQQRVSTLENRALHAEGQLMQRDRLRIHEAARARARILDLEIEKDRQNERMASKKARTRAEAAAATRLQRVAKKFLRRRRFKDEMIRFRDLQTGGRCMLLARRRHHCRIRRSKAALLFQRIWRGRSDRRRLATRERRVKLAQAIVRGHLQRNRVSDELRLHLWLRMEAAKVMQKNRRRCESQRAYLLLRSTSVMVQSAFRGHRARLNSLQRRLAVSVLQRAARQFLFKILRDEAATRIQNAYRLSAHIKRCRKERREIIAAAGVVQRSARAFVARRVVRGKQEARRRYRAAARLQRAMSSYACRARQHRRKVEAALTLLKFIAAVSVKLSRVRRRRESSAAEKIQSVVRMRRCRVKTSTLRDNRRKFKAASKIQALWRGRMSLVKTRIHRRRRERSALAVQRAWRKLRTIATTAAHTEDCRATTTKVVPERRSTSETSSGVLHTTGRAGFRMAVEALASGMARSGALTPIDAKELNESLALGADDAVLEIALRRRLSSLEESLNSTVERVVQNRRTRFKSVEKAVVEEGGVEGTLRQALQALESRLITLRPLE